MDTRAHHDADRVRAALLEGPVEPAAFRAALLAVPPLDRDAWVDRVLGLDDWYYEDTPSLPRGCVPYLACPADTVRRAVEYAALGARDVAVDVGAGSARAALLMHLLTGAPAVGLEIQPALVEAARRVVAQFPSARVTLVEGDAAELTGCLALGTVFFFYCPFSGERATQVRAQLESLSRARALRVCAVDWPMVDCPWLECTADDGDLVVYRSAPVTHSRTPGS